MSAPRGEKRAAQPARRAPGGELDVQDAQIAQRNGATRGDAVLVRLRAAQRVSARLPRVAATSLFASARSPAPAPRAPRLVARTSSGVTSPAASTRRHALGTLGFARAAFTPSVASSGADGTRSSHFSRGSACGAGWCLASPSPSGVSISSASYACALPRENDAKFTRGRPAAASGWWKCTGMARAAGPCTRASRCGSARAVWSGRPCRPALFHFLRKARGRRDGRAARASAAASKAATPRLRARANHDRVAPAAHEAPCRRRAARGRPASP